MSENKTREDIISEHSPHGEYNHYYHEHSILEMLTEFSDQEKRSTAIAFQDWIKKNKYWQDDEYNYWKSAKSKYIIAKSTAELYDLYLQSLSK